MKKIKITLIAFTSILLACKEKPKNTTKPSQSDIISVKVAPVSSIGSASTIQATGLVVTENVANYAFKIGGVISRILVEEGQFFKKGQLLATLNTTEISAGLAQANMALEKASRDYARAANLYRDSVFTLEQLQNTKTALDVAKKTSEATAFNLRYAQIHAASDGFVGRKMVGEGEVIGPGMPVLAINETGKNNSYLLQVGLTDREWATISLGQDAVVSLDGYADKKFDAFVFRKSQAADPLLGSFQVELKLKLNDVKPAVGMFGKAEIHISRDEHIKAVPYSSLIEADGNKAFVFTPHGANKVRKIPITISRFDNDQVYLKDGLDGVKEIVISNSAYLNEKSTIKIIR
ncbi:MAG: efflux RND transporter periplasmic adaptor subunit [Pedobacter agri]